MSSHHNLAPVELAPYAIRVLPAGGAASRVMVEGEIDLLTSPQLRAALEAELASAEEVILDLSRTQFIDSSGLQAIVLAVQAQSDGHKLKVSSSLPAQAQRLFELAGVLGHLPMVDE
jgi:anti-sigma B factor antagonist